MFTAMASVPIYATDSGLFVYFTVQLNLTTSGSFQTYGVHVSLMELSRQVLAKNKALESPVWWYLRYFTNRVHVHKQI